MTERGCRDNGSAELEQAKRDRGFGDRPDLQTRFGLHRAEEA